MWARGQVLAGYGGAEHVGSITGVGLPDQLLDQSLNAYDTVVHVAV